MSILMTTVEPAEQRIVFDPQELLRAAAFPHPVGDLSVRETHISWVILTGPFAYKIKKPVRFEFLDCSTLAQRHHFCKEELRLNSRLAPELYLDIVPVTRDDRGLKIGGDGTVVEYAVRMKQFAGTAELPQLLQAQQITREEVLELAELLARFHLHAPVARPATEPARTQQTLDAVLGNISQLLAQSESLQAAPSLRTLSGWCHEQAVALEPVLAARERDGFVRECHGDLHAGNIVRYGTRLLPFDGIEFDASLRWIDVMNDLAFLIMDLASRGRRDLALTVLSRYLEVTGDYHGVRLLPFYCVYRALVRAKIDGLLSSQQPRRAREFQARLAHRVQAALEWTQAPPCTLILMHGPSGSGKSRLSAQLAATVPAIRIRSDVERKRLGGIDPDEPAPAAPQQGIYSSSFNHRTYARLADCAERCLRAGFNVIIDAAFLDETDRAAFCSLARQLHAGFLIVACQADAITLADRILQRGREHTDPSDASLAVLDHQLRSLQPFAASEQPHVICVDTAQDADIKNLIAAVASRCGER